MTMFVHFSEVPHSVWRWPNFTPWEIASRGDGSVLLIEDALDALQAARNTLGRPMRINSAYRDPVHNALVGGAPRSKHKEGHAFDVSLAGHDKSRLVSILRECGFRGFGLRYQTFVHVDMGPRRDW